LLKERALSLIEIRLVTRDQADARAFAQKTERASQADAFAAAGDEDVLVFELEVHAAIETPL